MRAFTILHTTLLTAVLASVPLTAGLPSYKPATGFTGPIPILVQDAMEPLVGLLDLDFQKAQPGSNLDMATLASSEAVQQFITGARPLLFASRELTAEEWQRAATAHGKPPLRLSLAIEAVAVFVNNRCPLKKFTMEELDGIFSASPQSGRHAMMWGDLGAKGEWANRPMKMVSQPQKSGAREFFQSRVMGGQAFKSSVADAADAWAAQEAPASDDALVSFGPVGAHVPGVRVMAVTPVGSKDAVEPTPDNISKGVYPLSRFIYVYANQATSTQATRALLTFVFSKEGQKTIASYGTTPLPEGMAQNNLARIR